MNNNLIRQSRAEGREVPNRSEDIGTPGGTDLDPVAVVDLTVTGLLVGLDVAELSIEVHIAGGQVTMRRQIREAGGFKLEWHDDTGRGGWHGW